jgi:uncharacterized membrane protein
MNRIEVIWSQLRGSFWFLPSLIFAVSVVIAVMLIDADTGHARELIENWPRLFGSRAAGARGMLSTIAGSMMTVVGVTFSMTLVTLALASSQYTSRILRNFMADRFTQIVLGVFGGIFIYCLIVLRTIRGGEEDYVPSIAVLFGVVFAIGGIVMLIFFIHHIASSIQASSIIEAVTKETLSSIDRLLPREGGGKTSASQRSAYRTPSRAGDRPQEVHATRIGYIQSIDIAAVVGTAEKHDVVVRLQRGVGEFVAKGATIATIDGREPLPKAVVEELARTFNIYRFRTVEQDPAFGIRQIVDIALRALSPSVNDTTTAAMCVDYLSAILVHVVNRDFPPREHDCEGTTRVISVEQTFDGLLAHAFDQVRSNARGDLSILLHILEALGRVGAMARDQARRHSLLEYVASLEEPRESLVSAYERTRFDETMRRVRLTLASQTFIHTQEKAMLVRFKSSKTESITMFGDVAAELIRMLGASGAIPSAIAAKDLPAAAASLRQQLELLSEPVETASEEREPSVALAVRASPLLDIMKRAGDANVPLMWEEA